MAAGTIETVRTNRDGTTSYRLSVMIDGKRYRKTVRCKTKRDANNLLAHWVLECKDAVTSEITMSGLADEWLKVYASKRHKRSTLDNETRKIRKWISPNLPKKPACEISRQDVQGWVEKLLLANLDPKTIRNLYGLLKQICDWGVAMEYLKASPCQYITLPKKPARETHSLTGDELAKVLTSVTEDAPMHYSAAVMLAAFCGLRKGEILGLTWSDVDFDDGSLSITSTRLYQEGGGSYTDTPKSVAGIRTVYMPQIVSEYIHKLHTAQIVASVEHDAVGPDLYKYVISHDDGTPVQPQALAGWVRRYRDSHSGLPLWSMHTLRHTHASMLKAIGAPLEEIQKRLGHADKTTTQKVYVHLFTDPSQADKKTAKRIDDFFASK